MTTASHSDNQLPPPNIWTDPPPPDLATIVSKCGDLGIKAIAAMANVSEDDVRRAVGQDQAAKVTANRVRETRDLAEAALLEVLRMLGLSTGVCVAPVASAPNIASDLLAERWVLREDVKQPNAGGSIHPPEGWYLTSTGGRDGGSDVLGGPGECRIRIEPWGFAVTDADGDEAAAGVAAMRCAMAIHERRYGGASDPSTVTVQVLTSADIERLVLLFYWLTTKMSWHDLLGAIIDSAGVDMDSRGAETLARELVAELLRKNGGDCGGR